MLELDIDLLIIAAQISSSEIVYNRIALTCKINRICLYNMYGKDMFKIHGDYVKKKLLYPQLTKEDLQTTKDLILELNPHELRLHYLAYRVGTPIYNENKDISNGSQYIHSNKPNIKNNEITTEVNNIIESLQKDNYHLITEETDWNKYTDLPKNTKIAAFTPIKYGMCWYE